MLNCPVCTGKALWPLGTLTEMPMVGCQFAVSRSEAIDAPRGTLELCLCAECCHIYNQAFEPRNMRYGPDYDNTLDFSPKHREYQAALVRRLLDEYTLYHKRVVDIGCGQGRFLSQICNLGQNVGIGFDPAQTYRSVRVGDGHFTVLPDAFVSANLNAIDFVCSQQVLEHLHDPGSTLRKARSVLKDAGAAYFEVPNGAAIFRRHWIWDLTYEHVSYFLPASLQRALVDAGFAISRISASYGNQYLQADVRPAQYLDVQTKGTNHDSQSEANRLAAWQEAREIRRDFPSALRTRLAEWKDRLAQLLRAGCRIVLWGAGTKAVSFLNMLGIHADQVEFVVDINPNKVGRFVPGTGQKIISLDYLKEYRPTIAFVMNPQYLDEIGTTLNSKGVQCALVPILEGSPVP